MPKKRKTRGKKHSAKQKEEEVNSVVSPGIAKNDEGAGNDEGAYQVNRYTNEPVQPFFGALDPEEEKYFQQAEQAFANHFTRENEDTRFFVDSIYREVQGKELIVCNNVFGSKVLEKLFPLSTSRQIKSFFSALNGHYVELIQTTFGSYAFEKLLSHMAAILNLETQGVTEDQDDVLEGENENVFMTAETLLMYMYNEIRPEVSMLMSHKLAVHVLGKIFLLLDGYRFVYHDGNRTTMESISVPESFPQFAYSIIDSATDNLDTPELRAYCVDKYASQIMRAFIRIDFERSKKTKKKHDPRLVSKLLLSNEYDLKELPFMETLLKDETGSRILEVIVENMSASHLLRFYAVFEGRFYRLCVHPIANFIMQRYIRRLGRKEIGSVIDELKKNTDNIIRKSFLPVLRTLLEKSNHLHCYQDDIFSMIQTSVANSGKDANIIPCLLRSKHKRDKANPENKERKLVNNLLGAQLLEEMLHCEKQHIQLLLDSVLDLSKEQILEYCLETVSSHLIEGILDLSDLNPVFLKKFLNILSGSFVTLAVSAPGSHIVDKAWKATRALPLYRTRIVRELAEGGDDVKFDFYGKKVCSNWKVELFRRAPDEWYRFMKQDEPSKRVHERARQYGRIVSGSSANTQPLGEKRSTENDEELESGPKRVKV